MGDTRGVGCGIWPLLITNCDFQAACEWHDKAYSESSWAQNNMSRAEVDKLFLLQMLTIADGCPIMKAKARLFYRLARILGGAWWEGKL